MSKNLSHLSGRKGLDLNLFEQLGIAARAEGTPSAEEMDRLQDEFLFGKANVYGAVSFYDFLKEENKGKKAYVCNGSACLCAGTQEDVRTALKNHYTDEEVGEMCCLGRCHENAAFHIGGRNYSGNDLQKIGAILSGEELVSDRYHEQALGTAVITEAVSDPVAYYEIWKTMLQSSADKWLREMTESGLRGRGGAGFPMSFKLQSCRDAAGKVKYIVCNADEGDPGAYSDRYIMEQRPHALLLGMMAAGYMAGASWGVLYIRAEYPESIDCIQKVILWLADQGFTGEDIFGSGFSFRFKIIQAQGAYICGEETALLSSIEGQRPEVRVRPPFPTQQGLFLQPTVVNNVETLASVPYILRHGGGAYAAIGRGKSTGTKLVSLDSHFRRPGIYEVDMGTPLRTVTDTLGGGFRTAVKAMHIGGPLGGLVPVSKIDDLTVDFESFSSQGFLLGHASVVCIPDTMPVAYYIRHLFQFTAHESCGKCFPCRLGSTRGAELFEKALHSEYKIDRELLNDLLDTLEAGSLCALGGGLPLPVRNALQYFQEELALYFNTN